MPTVPTFLALTTAHAGLATKAMGAFVKVRLADKCHNKTIYIHFLFFLFPYSDIDECKKGSHHYDCHINANCTNTAGSYKCTCRPGYTGNGSICKGKNLPVNLYDAFIESGLIAPFGSTSFDTLSIVTLTLKPRW